MSSASNFHKDRSSTLLLLTGTQFKETVMKRVIEVRAAEGGEDSKLFVKDLADAYVRMAQRLG